MSKQLLREFHALCPDGMCQDLLTEREKREVANGALYLSGRMQTCEKRNGNGRVYPCKTLKREVKNYQKLIQENRAMGECDHPDTSVVELKNVSHIVREAYMEGDAVYGSIEILDTPSGKIIQSLIESGITLGISSRGVGSTKRQGDSQVVQEDFQLICFDMVSEPSTPGAYMLKEGKFVHEAELNKFFNKSDRIDRIFNDILSWSPNE